jgi:hypothetical protein
VHELAQRPLTDGGFSLDLRQSAGSVRSAP